jgi:hypothetical protein
MSKQHILLDTFESVESLSSYITEKPLANTSSLTNNPGLLKFMISDNLDFNDNINQNKVRMLNDNTTDAFVSIFFNDNNILKLLIDYQYQFIYFFIMSKINSELMNVKPLNRHNNNIDVENLYPLQHNEHIILSFKGGSTMFFLYNNILNYNQQQNGIDRARFVNIDKYFKISDIDFSVSIESENTFRYNQLESFVSKLITESLEEIANRFEYILLRLIVPDPDLNNELNNLKNQYTNVNTNLDDMNISIHPNAHNNQVFADIYQLKIIINDLKKTFNPFNDVNNEKKNEIETLLARFFVNGVNFVFYTVDILEINLICELICYLIYLDYPDDEMSRTFFVGLIYKNANIKSFVNYLLNKRFEYLIDNLYTNQKLENFKNTICDGLRNMNNGLLEKSIISYRNEDVVSRNHGVNLHRLLKCPGQVLQNGNINGVVGDYYPEYKYLTDTKAGIEVMYDLKDNNNIINDNIAFKGRDNFFLSPQDSSNYPYVLVTTNNNGRNNDKIKLIKNSINQDDDADKSSSNIHYISINKSILKKKEAHVTTFNLFRIKFNVILKKLIDKILITDAGCNMITKNRMNAPSEFLDVGFSSVNDTFHSVQHNIEANNNGIVFEFILNNDIYGKKSRVLSYHLESFMADLSNVLFIQNYNIPWLDIKYEKRMFRLLFYLFNVIHYKSINNIEEQIDPVNVQLNTFIRFFTEINENNITFDNLINANNHFTTSGMSVDNVIDTLINYISVPNMTRINSNIILTLLNAKTNINGYIILKNIYDHCKQFFIFTIIYLLVFQKLRDEMFIVNQNREDIMPTIRRYSKLIQQSDSTIVYNVKHYNNDNDIMDNEIVKNFIDEFRKFIKNTKNGLNSLRDIFIDGFNYNIYQVINY